MFATHQKLTHDPHFEKCCSKEQCVKFVLYTKLRCE